jgi:hypothetical protein
VAHRRAYAAPLAFGFLGLRDVSQKKKNTTFSYTNSHTP